MARRHLIKLIDAAVLTWPTGKKKPKTRQLQNVAAAGAFGGAFWSMLFGILFLVPLPGMALRAAMGALTGSMRDVGINDDDIVTTNLSKEQDEALRAAFQEEEPSEA